ncbi:hypothetical protein NsoK4_04540 [Nitrosopumilus sp. K4]|uniref:hypothetical protein n=1 Tax=Nitrosopumilus sp. K4 TaxID=2795383 RepID=UPI001BA87FE9|nr:hypothetical protein [Nitrosopumilus sp. K4]QUC65510.1 hypothetical protein NsoK4_04540 [Nitrosopumilus sp. K4]
MDRITLIEGYDPVLVRETLELLLRDRKNEFRELAETMKIPTISNDWEVIILKFCLDFEDCYKSWTDSHEPDSLKNTKCMTIMRTIAKGKKNISDVFHLQDIAYTICVEFHQTYNRIK